MDTNLLDNSLDNSNEVRLGREKQTSRTFQLDNASKSTIHHLLDSLIVQSKLSKSTLSINISILNGGVAGVEYTETKKIRQTS